MSFRVARGCYDFSLSRVAELSEEGDVTVRSVWMIPLYLFRRPVFSRSVGLVHKERQAWEVTSPAGRVPSESALRQTWSIRSGK